MADKHESRTPFQRMEQAQDVPPALMEKEPRRTTKADLAGKEFGRLTVIRDTGRRLVGGHVVWLCSCSCGGGTAEATTANLKSGNTTSCGCAQAEASVSVAMALGKRYGGRGRPALDLAGQRFGKLVAVRRVGAKWECLCDCGRTASVAPGHLRRPARGVRSCGCLVAEANAATPKCQPVDLAGKRFGRLTVLDRVPRLPGADAACWRCLCDCGKECVRRGADLRRRPNASCGCWKPNRSDGAC